MDKTIILVSIAMLAGIITMFGFKSDFLGEDAAWIVLCGVPILTLIIGFVICFSPGTAKTLAPFYAALEGSTLGLLTLLLDECVPGIGVQAVFITLFLTFACLALYRSNLVNAALDARVACVALLVILGAYILDAFTGCMGMLESGPIGIVVAIVIACVYCYVLMVDFKTVGQAITHNMPKEYEWYFAYSIMLTIILLYIQILRILAMFSRRR
ncbi:MAG: Bax inhibitor-1/YccA family protein [bacterium]|nr:Bax inhibitor-1/YccA family protein [bacterium]